MVEQLHPKKNPVRSYSVPVTEKQSGGKPFGIDKIRTFFSVGYSITEPVRRAVRAMPDRLWRPALDQDRTLRDGAEVAELTAWST